MNILHAHTDPTMLDRLKSMLASSDHADIAVGYLFISGFNAVSEELGKLDKVRLLVGRTDRATLDEVASGLQQTEALAARVEGDQLVRPSARIALGAQAVRTIADGVARLPQDEQAECGVARLRDLITQGRLEIKTYPKGTLHAKAYLCWYKGHAEPGAAIVGSSNFTLAGFEGNTELNVRVTGDAEMAELKRWFDALWTAAVDVTEDIKVVLQQSWALAVTPPYHVYLKALYELYRDELGAPELVTKKQGAPELADFQLDAVRRGLRMIDQRGGCFIGDVVGLGKTYIGAELVRQLQFGEPQGRHPLIVCPAGLMPMWELVSERFGLGAEVISMSTIAPPPGAQFDEESGSYVEAADAEEQGSGLNLVETYPNRGVVLVDEAHNFRNPGTRRYKALSDYLWRGEHKVILISATPQNLGPSDIYHQLRLFLDDLDHGLNLEPLHLQEYFGAVQQWYAYRVELENWQRDYQTWQLQSGQARGKKGAPPPSPAEPHVPYATIDQVLNPVFLRRRRKDIQELYGDNIMVAGKRVQFPEPKLDNLTYRLDKVYAKAGAFTAIQGKLRDHRGARYLAVTYLKREARQKEQYRDLLRARNRVARLMRYLLFKRLESSVEAFRSTLGVLVRSNRNFRSALEEGFVPVGQTATGILQGKRFNADELLGQLADEEQRRRARGAHRATLVHSTADFEVDRWLADLDSDHAILQGLLTAIARIAPSDDDKLQRLRAFLAQTDVAEGKVLIFSEAEATVSYLYEQLNPGGADPSIAMVSGATRDQLQSIVKRFAPLANLKPNEALPGPPVRVLIATDVISEGQNLQDCNRVLNYDLHWNPVRLIQRFGRVDRIGTTHETIYLQNMWPDTDVDAELTLTERLHNRIQAFHDFIGLDTQLLSDTERINPSAMYRIYEQKRLPEGDDVLDEVAAHQRGIALLQSIQQTNADLWRTIGELPDGIRSALPVPAPPAADQPLITFQLSFGRDVQLPLMMPAEETGIRTPLDAVRPAETVVLLKQGDRALGYAVGSDLVPRPLSPSQLLQAMDCPPETAPSPLPTDTNARVMAAYDVARHEVAMRIGRARRPSTDTRLRRYLARHLREAKEIVAHDPEESKRISTLQQIFLDHLPSATLADLAEVRRMELTGPQLVRRLEALRERHRLNPTEQSGTTLADVEVIRIVCSDGLL